MPGLSPPGDGTAGMCAKLLNLLLFLCRCVTTLYGVPAVFYALLSPPAGKNVGRMRAVCTVMLALISGPANGVENLDLELFPALHVHGLPV